MSGAGRKSLPSGQVRAYRLESKGKRQRAAHLTHSCSPRPTPRLHPGHWAWSPTPPQQEPMGLTCLASQHSLLFLV